MPSNFNSTQHLACSHHMRKKEGAITNNRSRESLKPVSKIIEYCFNHDDSRNRHFILIHILILK